MATQAFNKHTISPPSVGGNFLTVWWLGLLLCLAACRNDYDIAYPEQEQVDTVQTADSVVGFYLLNEGNMGTNKATLDYYDYATGTYTRNIYVAANPSVPMELGDVGNDLQAYGDRLYAVINCSNKLEVMDKRSARRIGQVDIPNCRYVCFDGAYAYVTSYAGPVQINPDYRQRGYVAKVDTATLAIVDTCLVGYQPDGIAVADGKLYVANSGGYRVPNYEHELSVIDLATFREIRRIPVAINLQHVMPDDHHQLWVTSRGDYRDTRSKLYCVDTRKDIVTDSLDLPVSGGWIDGDSLYAYSTEWSYETMQSSVGYAIIHLATHQVVTRNFIADGTEKNIKIPYGFMVHPQTKDIYIADARDYVTPGRLYCYSPDGHLRWQVRTGDIPGHFALVALPRPSKAPNTHPQTKKK